MLCKSMPSTSRVAPRSPGPWIRTTMTSSKDSRPTVRRPQAGPGGGNRALVLRLMRARPSLDVAEMEASAVLETADSYRMKVVSHHCSMLASALAQSRTAPCDVRSVTARIRWRERGVSGRSRAFFARFVAARPIPRQRRGRSVRDSNPRCLIENQDASTASRTERSALSCVRRGIVITDSTAS